MKEFFNEHFLEAMPLEVSEVIHILKTRWGVTYELKIVQKGQRLYLQMMWGYLEQQSFIQSENIFQENLAHVLEIINRLGLSSYVRDWLRTCVLKPKLGRAVSLPLKVHMSANEFVL